jgi:CDP-4-dehydro-6-deoxyglucose reductase, E1
MNERAEQLRKQILALTAEYHAAAFPVKEFLPGTSSVPVSGKVIGRDDICSVVDLALDAWFTTGRFAKDFERKLAQFVGVRSASLVNSGSSAPSERSVEGRNHAWVFAHRDGCRS